MILHSFTLAELDRETGYTKDKGKKKSWQSRASKRTSESRKQGSFVKAKSEFWGELKKGLQALQSDKCAYCERRLPDSTRGSVESDVEHYRPKSQTTVWQTKLTPLPGTGRSGGYWWLAYDPLNYAVGCKTCNSALKRDRFPIDGTAGAAPKASASGTVAALAALNAKELPLLLFPVGPKADDPAQFLEFLGVLARPKAGVTGKGLRRALVTIDFFELNSAGREDLLRTRAEMLTAAANTMRLIQLTTGAEKAAHQNTLHGMTQRHAQVSACVASYVNLAQADPSLSDRIATAVRAYASSGDKKVKELLAKML